MINKNKIGVSMSQRKNGRRNWVTEIIVNDKKISKNFAVSKYGEEKAKLLATYERLLMEKTYSKYSRDHQYFLFDLLTEIAKFYWCEITKELEGTKSIIIINGADERQYRYKTIEDGLKDWYTTLVETDECCVNEEVDKIWDVEISFIERYIKI